MEINVSKSIAAQIKLCKEKEYPHFAPRSGICYACGSQIYETISVERASSDLITGCPLCHRSYCD